MPDKYQELIELRRKLRAAEGALRLATGRSSVEDTAKIRALEADLRAALTREARRTAEEAQARADAEERRRAITDIVVPKWLEPRTAPAEGPGVPTIFCSDWHAGEGIVPSDVGGANAYGPAVFQERVKRLLNTSIDLLFHHMVRPEYPGIVVALGGDMVDHLNRWVHSSEPENPLSTRGATDSAAEALVGLIDGLAGKFDRLFVPAVAGNHGRLTSKMSYTQRSDENLDAMLYDRVRQVVHRDTALRRRVSFAIAEGAEVRWQVYGQRYLLLHGDPASLGSAGGDGIIGALGPVARGNVRKRAQQSQIGRGHEVLLMGHYHQWTVLPGVIVNGSIKGYDAYAYNRGFPYEPPRQAMWLTHPKWGITCHWPVYVDPAQGQKPASREQWLGLDKLYAEG